MNIDKFRRFHLAVAEWIDSWRLLPRAMVMLYMWLMYEVTIWFMSLESYMADGCVPTEALSCLIEAPTSQHTAFISAVIGMAAAIFGLYTRSGETQEVPPVIPQAPLPDEEFAARPKDDNY